MQTANETILINRFFVAIDFLKRMRKIRGLQTFTRRYDIDRRNMMKLRTDVNAAAFRATWLMYLAQDYGISSKWLLTGEGNIMKGIDVNDNIEPPKPKTTTKAKKGRKKKTEVAEATEGTDAL